MTAIIHHPAREIGSITDLREGQTVAVLGLEEQKIGTTHFDSVRAAWDVIDWRGDLAYTIWAVGDGVRVFVLAEPEPTPLERLSAAIEKSSGATSRTDEVVVSLDWYTEVIDAAQAVVDAG